MDNLTFVLEFDELPIDISDDELSEEDIDELVNMMEMLDETTNRVIQQHIDVQINGS